MDESIGESLIDDVEEPDFWVRDWMRKINEQGIDDPAISGGSFGRSFKFGRTFF